MPHTIIDIEEPLEIPDNQLVWGLIKDQNDLSNHMVSLESLSQVTHPPHHWQDAF